MDRQTLSRGNRQNSTSTPRTDSNLLRKYNVITPVVPRPGLVQSPPGVQLHALQVIGLVDLADGQVHDALLARAQMKGQG